MISGPHISAMLFMGAKVTHLAELPQGQPERMARVVSVVDQHDAEGFGGCTNIGACSTACPKGIPQDVISTLNHDLMKAWRIPVYYDQAGTLTRRFGIRQVPALVSQDGLRLRIDELEIVR